jgi:hypothetical protein
LKTGCGRCTSRKIPCVYARHQDVQLSPPKHDEEKERQTDLVKHSQRSSSKNASMIFDFDNDLGSDNVGLLMDTLIIPDPSPAIPIQLTDSMSLLAYDSTVTLSGGLNNPGIEQLQRTCYDFYPNPATTPALPRHSMDYLFRVMRTWPRMIARGFQLPPIFHHSQTISCNTPQVLAKCFVLTKMWYNENEASPEMIRTAVGAEMEVIFNTVSFLRIHYEM